MKVLAFESSCDETSVAVVENGREVLSNVIASQIDTHKKFGGVVPEIASRQHVEAINTVLKEGLDEADVDLDDIDLIAATKGPGLIGALLVGLSAGKALALAENKPFVGVNHIEGHVCANYISSRDLEPPFVGLIISGGHTYLIEVKDYIDFTLYGRTVDDAVGEAFDKVARSLGLPYPGGPVIDSANSRIREAFVEKGKKENIKIFYPDLKLCTDNAAMIASAAYYNYISGKVEKENFANPNLGLK